MSFVAQPRAMRASTPSPSHSTTIDDRDSLLRLIAAAGAANVRRELLDRHGNPAAALAAGPKAWRECGLSSAQIQALGDEPPTSVADAVAWLQQPGHHLIGWHDRDYPPQLRRVPGPPLALFVAGDPTLLWHPSVAVVGSRSPTPGGRGNAADFARALAASGLAVASGLAAGIDTAAHEAVLTRGGLTFAVLGCGPDVAYPLGNADLLARMSNAGAVVSEHLPGTAPQRSHFPSRNRIIAGLSLATVVIEAAMRSGALITARLAAEAGRDVFAVPGSIHNPLARGCHRLIRDGAGLVEDAAEIISALAPQAQLLAQDLRSHLNAPIHPVHGSAERATRDSSPQDPDYQKLWQALGHDPTDMDQLVARTGLTAATVSSMLLLMELDGRVHSQHGRYFRNR